MKLIRLARRVLNKFGYDLISLNKFDVTDPSALSLCSASQVQEPIQAHMFWAYGDFSQIERLAASSYIANGFELKVWTYGDIPNLPSRAQQLDARTILPETRVFTYNNGSYAGFADLFRYTLLSQHGGLWSDTDIICLKHVSQFYNIFSSDGFWVSERTENSIRLNNNLIYHPQPRRGDLISLAAVIADQLNQDILSWGICGPKLLTNLALEYPDLAPTIMAPLFANPINWWDCPSLLLQPHGLDPRQDFWFLHCYNEMWRQSNIDKNAPFPANSILGQLCDRYQSHLI